MSPRAPLQHQSQSALHVPSFPVTSASSGQTIAAQGLRSDHCENQSKNYVFSNALSSPICRSLQHYQIGEGGCYTNGLSMGNGNRNTEPGFLNQQSRDSNAVSSNDSAMDMHADQPCWFINWEFLTHQPLQQLQKKLTTFGIPYLGLLIGSCKK